MAIKLSPFGFEDVMDEESYGTNPFAEDITQNELQGLEGEAMAEPTRFTSLEADAGGLPTFTTPSSIFDIPNTLLGGFPIGADSGAGFLPGSDVGFNVPGVGANIGNVFTGVGSMAPSNISLGDLINPWAQRTDITQLAPNWGTWNPSTDVTTAADFSGVKLTGTPFSNVGIDQTAISGGRPTVTAGSEISTTAAQGGAVQLDPFEVSGTRVQTGPVVNLSDIYTPRVTGGEGLLGGVSTTVPGTALVMDPFQVTDTTLPRATLNLTPQTQATTTTGGAGTGTSSDITTLPAVTVTGTRDTTPTMSTPDMIDLLNRTNVNVGQPVQLPPFVTTTSSTTATTTVTPVTPNVTTPTINPPPSGVIIPPQVTVPPPTTTPPPTTITPTTTPTATTVGPATPATPTTTTTSSAMNQRDLKAELEKTMAAFNEYRPQIQSMYGDLYQQFMPKGLTAAEPGIINQYQADLARLQQRQAGMLSPEDIRQSQQSAREAYGARGQVMGPGAIGAEILNREAIRQQREDQARAALQSSYGNVLNMANLQTGNLFSPIASLISSTFNPLGAYPADVYGTNVNAQLARDIAQKNYEAAIRSAELSGAAGRTAATTSAAGQIGSAALPWLLTSIFCWVAREIYGENNPKWLKFREWMMTRSPSWFFNFYLEHGERIAAWLKRNPWAKRPIRMWMDSRIRSMEKHELVLKEAV